MQGTITSNGAYWGQDAYELFFAARDTTLSAAEKPIAVTSLEHLRSMTPCLALAKRFGQAAGFENVVAIGPSSSGKTGSIRLCNPGTKDVVKINDLGDLLVYNRDLASRERQWLNRLLPEPCQAILAKPRGSLTMADVNKLRYTGVAVPHLHDAPGNTAPLIHHMNKRPIYGGYTSVGHSMRGGLVQDVLRMAADKQPVDFISKDMRTKALEETGVGSLQALVLLQVDQMMDKPIKRQEFLDVMRPAGASGKIPELASMATNPPSSAAAAVSSSSAGPGYVLGATGSSHSSSDNSYVLPLLADVACFMAAPMLYAAADPLMWEVYHEWVADMM